VFGSNGVADPTFMGVVIPSNAAAGGYENAAVPPRYTQAGTTPYFALSVPSSGNSSGAPRGVTWEISGSTSTILGTNLETNTVARSSTIYSGPSQGAGTN